MVITIACPSCQTSFPVDPGKIPEGGVKVRCSRCAHVFRVEEPVTVEAAEASAQLEVAPFPPDESDAAPAYEGAGDGGWIDGHDSAAAAQETAVPGAEPEGPAAEADLHGVLEADADGVAAAEEHTEFAEPEASAAVEEHTGFAEPEASAAVEEHTGFAVEEHTGFAEPEASAAVEEHTGFAEPEASSSVEDATPELGGEFDGAGVAEPSPGGVQGFTFGRRDPTDKARRLARVLVSDMVMYNAERHQVALSRNTLVEDFEEEIDKSWKEFVDQVGPDMADGQGRGFWTEALNDILAKGERVF